MSRVQTLQTDFTAGVRRQRSRDALGREVGANVLWNARDWIIGRLGVPLGKRGGWAYQGAALASTPGRVRAIVDGPFNGGHYVLVVEADGTVQRGSGVAPSTWAIDGTTANVGAIKQNPIFFIDEVIFPSYDGSAGLFHANESTVSALTGPVTYEPTYIVGHKGRVWGIDGEILAAGPPGGPGSQTWDDDGAYDLTQPGTGIASVGDVMLAFFGGSSVRITGSIPAGYGVTNDDITIKPFSGDVGCIDAFSICYWEGTCIWVDQNGVWASDGNTIPLDLTFQGSAKDLFLEFISNWTTNMRVAAGIYSDLLFVTMTNKSTNAFVDCLVCDLPRRSWWRFKNFPFSCFAQVHGQSTPQTLAGVETVAGRVAALSGILSPTASNYEDADGTDVEPDFETAYFRFGMQPARIAQLFLGYEIDYIGTQATLTNQNITYTSVGYGTDPNDITVQIVTSGAGSSAVVTVSGTAILVTIGSATTKNAIVAAIAGSAAAAALITSSVPGPNGTDTGVAALAATALTGGTRGCKLQVDFATDPKASPTFADYSGAVYLEPQDIHGDDDEGYHWKPVPVRAQAPGIAVRVRQTGPSAKTSIFGLGSEATPLPEYTQQ